MSPNAFLRAAAALSLSGLALSACSDSNGRSEDLGSSSAAISPIPGCDYSFARPSPASLVGLGYKFAARYLSGDPGGGKDITSSEANGLTGAGLDIVLVWETTGTDATSGYNQGVSDATAANSEAASVGEPASRPIYFAIDFDASSGDSASINAYFQGVASVIGLSRTGVYGGYFIVNELFNAGLIAYGWQTYAWSGGAWDTRAQLRQTQNGVDNDELDDDEGMVADYGQWGPGAPSTAEYAAAYVSQSFPLASTALDMVEGQTIPSYIELKNVGTKSWDSNTHIGTTQPRDRTSVFADSSWLSPDRPAGVASGVVPPGSTYKFQFNLHAPATAGTYHEYFGVVEDGVVWFSDPGQGGPPDNDLEVQIVVTAPESRGTDGGAMSEDGGAIAESDSGSRHIAGEDAGRGGVLSHDAGHHGQPASDGGEETPSNPGQPGAPTGSSGGCRMGAGETGEAPSVAPFALLGLLMFARRRRSGAR